LDSAGLPVNLSTAGWFAPDQGKTNTKTPLIALVNANKNDPEQTAIRTTYELAKLKLENDVALPNPTCSAWFNQGLGGATAAQIIAAGVLPNRFAHAEFSVGGTIVGGEDYHAFIGDKNHDRSLIVGIQPDSAVHINRNGAFFKSFYSAQARAVPTADQVGPYPGGSVRARLVIALHELAHILQDRSNPPAPPIPVSINTVPGFQLDGGDPTGQLSSQNTAKILQMCRTMIERP